MKPHFNYLGISIIPSSVMDKDSTHLAQGNMYCGYNDYYKIITHMRPNDCYRIFFKTLPFDIAVEFSFRFASEKIQQSINTSPNVHPIH